MAVHVERRDRVALVTIDRPERRNAVDEETLAHLGDAVDAGADAGAIVLTGAGGHFCAGADLAGVEGSELAVHLRRVLDALAGSPVPSIAAVEGAALGAGTQLAIACDLRVAAADATFGIPAARLGLMVDQATVQRLALLAGSGPARAMLLAAEVLSGAEAREAGLVQRTGGLDDALAWAEEIAVLAPLTIAGHKLMLSQLEAEPADDPAVEAAFRRAWDSDDLAEGLTAFREKRRPTFRGR